MCVPIPKPAAGGLVTVCFPQTLTQLCAGGNPDTSGFWLTESSAEYSFVFLFLINQLRDPACESAGSSCGDSEDIILVTLAVSSRRECRHHHCLRVIH